MLLLNIQRLNCISIPQKIKLKAKETIIENWNQAEIITHYQVQISETKKRVKDSSAEGQ